MGARSVWSGARRRIEMRGIVNRYLLALERDEHQPVAGFAGDPAGVVPGLDSAALEPAFIRVAAEFGRRHRIAHGTWLEAKVSAEVLEAAGVTSALVAPMSQMALQGLP